MATPLPVFGCCDEYIASTPKKNTVNIDDIDKEIRLEWTTIPST